MLIRVGTKLSLVAIVLIALYLSLTGAIHFGNGLYTPLNRMK